MNNTVQKENVKSDVLKLSITVSSLLYIHTNLLNLLRALSFSYFSFAGIQVQSFSQKSSAFFLETERNLKP